MNGRLTITEVAKYIGVTPRTIMRWEKTSKIKRSRRDWRGWRFYLKEDMEDIRKFYESSYEYDGSRGGATIDDLTKATLLAVIMLSASLSLPYICGSAFAAGETASRVSADSDINRSGAIVETSRSIEVDLTKLPTITAPQSPATTSDASKYTLGPNDVIEIEVKRHPEFSAKYTVNSEGKIEYKFVGDIYVQGLTKIQLQEKITLILGEYVKNPNVNIQILEYMSKVFYVIGEVNKPGKFFMKGNTTTVRDAIMEAGLPNQGASTRKCRLISPNQKGKENMVYVNVYELLYAGKLEYNLEMKPGDVLYVPSTIVAKVIKVISPVTNAVSSAAGSAASGAALAL